MRITYRYKNCEIDQDLKDYLSLHINKQVDALSESDGWSFNFTFEQLGGRYLVIAQTTTPGNSLIQIAGEENNMATAIYKVISELKLELAPYEAGNEFGDMRSESLRSVDMTYCRKKVSRYVPLSKFDSQRIKFQDSTPAQQRTFSFSDSSV